VQYIQINSACSLPLKHLFMSVFFFMSLFLAVFFFMSLFLAVFSLFVVRKEVKKEDAEEKIKSTGKKSTAKRKYGRKQ